NKSTEALAAELTRRGHQVRDKTFERMLDEMGYSMQMNRNEKEGPQHPDRDAQFQYINRQEASFRASGDPVISADTKKKELVGAFKNGGRRGGRKGTRTKFRCMIGLRRPRGRPFPTGSTMSSGIEQWSTWGSATTRQTSRRKASDDGGGWTAAGGITRPVVGW